MNVKVRGVDSYLYLSVQSDLSPSSTFLILSSGTVKGLLGNMGGNNSESGYNIYGYLISLLAIVIVRRYDSNHLLRAQDIAQKSDDNEKDRNDICDYSNFLSFKFVIL